MDEKMLEQMILRAKDVDGTNTHVDNVAVLVLGVPFSSRMKLK